MKKNFQRPLADYQKIYGVCERTLHRWLQAGLLVNDSPPLDAPEAMLAWWSRHMKQRVPAKLLFAAKRPGSAAVSESASIDIETLESAAGDAVRQAGSYLTAAHQHLTEAYKSGDDSRIEITHRRWLKAVEAKRKAEAAAREDAKIKGDLIPAAEILPAIAQLIEVMKQMRRSARRRIPAEARLDLSPEQSEKLDAAIDKELARGEAVFRQLKKFKSLEEIDQFELNDVAN
jgi:hypothetical protein